MAFTKARLLKHDFPVHGKYQKNSAFTRTLFFFEKFARTFALVPVTRVRSATEIVQMNLFI